MDFPNEDEETEKKSGDNSFSQQYKYVKKSKSDDDEEEGNLTTTSNQERKDDKDKKTEVHRTQYILGLKGQAEAENRRFDINKIINAARNTHKDKTQIPELLREEEEPDSISGTSIVGHESNSNVHNEKTSSYYSSRNTSLSYHSQEEPSVYDDVHLEASSNSFSCASSTSSTDNFDDDVYVSERDKSVRFLRKSKKWSIIGLSGCFFILLIVAGSAAVANSREEEFAFLVDDPSNSSNITYVYPDVPSFAPSTIMTTSFLPTDNPTLQPTMEQSNEPSSKPSFEPTNGPSSKPSIVPSNNPSSKPSFLPTYVPSSKPSIVPSNDPSSKPSFLPTYGPSSKPSNLPSNYPSSTPSFQPSDGPTVSPSQIPSTTPSETASSAPSSRPSHTPTNRPSILPSISPSSSSRPSDLPSNRPTFSSRPSMAPSTRPSSSPSESPSLWPTTSPSALPTGRPTVSSIPSMAPTEWWYEVRGRLTGGPKVAGIGEYGQSVSVSRDGNTLAVTNLAYDKVEMYDNVDNQWLLRGQPIPAPPGTDPAIKVQLVAVVVSISSDGNTVAVGGSVYDDNKGIVRVFQWDGLAWIQMGQNLIGHSTVWRADFGKSIELSGTSLDLAVGSGIGKTTVYHFDGTSSSWIQKGSNHTEHITRGLAWNSDTVSITDGGDYYAVGAPWGEFVLVFEWDEEIDDWVQLGRKLEPAVKNEDLYGVGVELKQLVSGNLVLAVLTADGDGNVMIYDYDTSQTNGDWIERGGRVTSPGSFVMGYELEMTDDGNTIVTSTESNVIVFDWDESGSVWNIRSTVMRTMGYPDNDQLGLDFFLAISGDGSIVVVGMPYDHDSSRDGANRGQVRTFSTEMPPS